MHVNKTKQIAIAGLLAAVVVILMVLSSAVETSSLFFIAAASFLVGVVIREWGNKAGIGFYIVSSLVNFLVAPDKFYCVTYVALGLYILLSEFLWEKIAESGYLAHRRSLLWLGKFAIFNVMFVPATLFLQKLLFLRYLETWEMLVVVFLGQIALVVYDNAYRQFQGAIWGRIRIKLMR